MMEVSDEATRIPQHAQRLVLFFAAMRHFRDALRMRGFSVLYSELEDQANRGSMESELRRRLQELRPRRLVVVQPGEYRLESMVRRLATEAAVELEIRSDRHFFCDRAELDRFQSGKKSLVMESFYRGMRRRHGLLLEDGAPSGGRWNFDSDNRATLRSVADVHVPEVPGFTPLAETRRVIDMVRRVFPRSPGDPGSFDYPTTTEQAQAALQDFVEHRLAKFGRYQDAMLTGEAYLFHSRLSSSLNLHLLAPRQAVRAALDALDQERGAIGICRGIRQANRWLAGVRTRHIPDAHAQIRRPQRAGRGLADADLHVDG